MRLIEHNDCIMLVNGEGSPRQQLILKTLFVGIITAAIVVAHARAAASAPIRSLDVVPRGSTMTIPGVAGGAMEGSLTSAAKVTTTTDMTSVASNTSPNRCSHAGRR